MTSLRDELGEADARAFTGRASELRVVDVFFDHDSAYRFLFVHGPQGIGKSALLREIARRGRGLGYDVRQQDPRAEFAPITDHPVLLIGDDVLQLAETAVDLRDRLLDTMPPGTRIVLASRERPHPAWWSGGLDALAREIRLGPLTDDDARRLVAARGVDSTLWQDEILAWAQGVPLALNVATTLESPGGARTPHLEPALEDRLAGWLSGEAIGTVDHDLLEVAALTPWVDARMLAAALPGRNLRGAMGLLFELPVISRQGHTASLHPSLRHAVATTLRTHDRARYRELKRRLATHLAARARIGETESLVLLSSLIESPDLVSGTAPSGTRTHVADVLRDGDLDVVGRPPELVWFTDAFAERITVVRRADGTVAGLVGGAPLGTILGHQDVLATTIAQVLQAQGCEQERTLVGPVIVLESGPDAVNEMLRVGYSAALRRSGIADIRHLLSYYPEPTQCPSAFLAAAPWREVPLGAQLAGWLIDWGPAGAIGFALNTVLAEQGFPDRLGDESLLARGAEGRLADALPQIFGDSPEDRMLCTIIEMTHVRRDLSQAQILNTLHVSRATYFRLLRQARERVLAAG